MTTKVAATLSFVKRFKNLLRNMWIFLQEKGSGTEYQ